ncbi:carboxy terminal-processing peptidase [Spongiibacter pelagi]|uniref:carboxy terminal-processing peptidase n=1 Tax=Spongiibacter pelagi TaxID=2760804 RepID=UPI001CC238CD|nr:carboxy terminal-processing peptidase [Spongiibacter pelagi]
MKLYRSPFRSRGVFQWLAVLSLLVTLTAPSFAATITALQAEESQQDAIRDMLNQLQRRHYVQLSIDDALSSKLLDVYLEDLDPGRQFFLQSDIQEFEKYRLKFDDQLKQGQLSDAFVIFNRYRERVIQRLDSVLGGLPELISSFDFTSKEAMPLDRSEAPWPKNGNEAAAIWKQQIKSRVLSLKIAGKEDDAIVELLEKRFRNQLRRMQQLESEDAFQSFANAYASLYDPHTDYFSPRISENFQINMSLKLEGIGAVLQAEDDFTKVVRLVPAGPAEKQGQLQPADRIIGVAQGKQGEMQDVIGWRLDDVVDQIRGPAGSIVRLEVIPASAISDEERQVIVIERNEVKLEEQSAKGEMIELPNAKGGMSKIGVIDIPTFYLDFEGFRRGDPDFRSTTRDVHRILGELLSEGAEGILIDLRDNGGGSLAEANALVGLFIEQGPTVQIRQSNSRVIREGKSRRSPYYSGPLAVLINRMSASASEIFAGAIQDYQRGLILGTQSFGKGTVQSVNPLPHGQLKLTESKFYRISGDSTQNRGVLPDIAFPPIYDMEKVGENSLDNALAWDRIAHARHNYYFDFKDALPKLRASHDSRIAKDPDFIYLRESLAQIEKIRNEKTLSLNLKQRIEERDTRKAEQLAMENRRRAAKGEELLKTLDAEEEEEDAAASAEAGNDKDEDKPDPYLHEAASILIDAKPYFVAERLAQSR